MKLSRREIIGSLLILFIIIVINFSAVFTNNNYPLNDADNNSLFALKLYSAKMFLRGVYPLWDNLFFTGTPFYDQEVANSNVCNGISFILAFLLRFFNNPYFAFSLVAMLLFLLTGWFSYIVSRKVFALSSLASYFVAVIYMLNMGQMERVMIMPGGFMIAPLLILCADKIAEGKILFYSLLCGFLQAVGVYFGNIIAIGWASIIFIYFLIYFTILKNGFNLKSCKKFIISIVITYGAFILLISAIVAPFIYNLPSYLNIASRSKTIDLSQLINPSFVIYAISQVFFSNLFGLQAYVSLSTHDMSLLTSEISDSIFLGPIFGGYWNYWTILFYPLTALFIFNIKSFSKKELAVPFLILIYYIHFFLMAFNHFTFLEYLLLQGRNLLMKLQFIMQLAGGLFVGIIFNKILLNSNTRNIRKLNLVKIICYPIILIYGLISSFFLGGILMNILSKNKLDILAQKFLLYLLDNFKILSNFKSKSGDFIITKIRDTTHIIINHFLNSEFTIKYLFMFLSRLIIISLFLFLISRLLKNKISYKKIMLTVTLILAFCVIERISILKLYCPFNQDGPKNFSEEYKEIQYLKANLKNFERTTVITNDYYKIMKHLNEKYNFAVINQDTLSVSVLDKEKYYQIWKDFPESFRNGMPLIYNLNAPLEINTLNGMYIYALSNIWDVYNQINLNSDFYKHLMKANEIITNTELNIYTAESSFLDLLGVKYVLSSLPLNSKKLSFIMHGDKYYLYQNKKAYPRVWVVDRYVVEKDRNKILKIIADNRIDLLTTAIFDNQIDGQNFNANEQKMTYQVNIIEYTPNFIKINAQVNKKSLLVLSDTYFRDWNVYINGEKSDIKKVDYLFRGVFLNPGKNTVIFDFKPKIFFDSVIISIFAFVLVCFYLSFKLLNKTSYNGLFTK